MLLGVLQKATDAESPLQTTLWKRDMAEHIASMPPAA